MKRVLFCLTFIGLLTMGSFAHAAFPDKPITMIVPTTAGGHQDLVARVLVPSLEKELGVKIVIKNVGGAGGTLGAAEVSKAAPDGYTIGYLSIGPVTLQPQVRKLPYTVDSFTPVARASDSPVALLVKGDSPMNTLADAKKFLEEKKGNAAFGSPAPSGLSHIAAVAIFDAMGVQAIHIPDIGGAEVIKNLAGGHIQFYAEAISFLNTYDVKALGVFTDKRVPEFPDLPTAKEQGYDLEFSMWTGVLAPKGVPGEIVSRLEKAVEAAVSSPDFIKLAKKDGITISYLGSKDFTAYLAKQAAKGKELIEKYKMKQE